jgi:DNA invertase Pin-like site-specific DNA recombinase
MASESIPVAQYLRMSTEHQQYSFENQASAIQIYAESRGFQVVRTYSDAAKSGLVLKRRAGLRQLLQDVASGIANYRAILVYDVSRWGRFQDADESAHYEFLCKLAGVPVHYCAEVFANDGTLPSFIMKALKRTMAGEYSRELGVKVLAGQKRLAAMGFKQGGMPGYGFRRLLVSTDRRPKHHLAFGERKSLVTDRVILIAGPDHELSVVRKIYDMLIYDGMAIYAIARELNKQGIKYQNDARWTHHTVAEVLTNPKYAGMHTYARTSGRLYTRKVRLPKSEWILTHGAFTPLVDHATFLNAQQVLAYRTINKSNEQLLASLRLLLRREGRLSMRLIKNSTDMPSPSTYRQRFGSLRAAYKASGYGQPEQFGPIDLRRRTQALREELIKTIAAAFPDDVSIVRPGGRWRSKLRLRNGEIVSVLVARSLKVWKDTVRWIIDPVERERCHVTLLSRLDLDNRSFLDFHVFPRIERLTRFQISCSDAWLLRGVRLDNMKGFVSAVQGVMSLRDESQHKKNVRM